MKLNPLPASNLDEIRKSILSRPTINIGHKKVLELYTDIYTPRRKPEPEEDTSSEEELPVRVLTESSDPYSEEEPAAQELQVEEVKEEV